MTPEKQEILEKLRTWALENDDVMCVMCTGSHGNQVSEVADEFSDIDVVVFTKRIPFYLHNPGWAPEALGPVAFEYIDDIVAPGIPGVKKLFFENGVRVDMLFWEISAINFGYRYLKLKKVFPIVKWFPTIIRKMLENRFSYFPKYIRRGFDTIVDKRNLTHKGKYIEANHRYRNEPFTEKKLQGVVGRFWTTAICMAIYISRKELFVAKIMGDRTMKLMLLHLIELYTRKLKGPDYDMWADGRHMEDWAPPFITRRMKTIYGYYEADDAWRAMMETIDLFSLVLTRLTTEFPEVKVQNPEKYFRKMIKAVEVGTMKAMLTEYSG